MRQLRRAAGVMFMGAAMLAAVFGAGLTVTARQDDGKEGAGGETYYYRKGEKIPLKIDRSKSYVLFAPAVTQADVETTAKTARAVVNKFETIKGPAGLNVTQNPAQGAKWAIVENADATAQAFAQGDIANKVLYKAPFVVTPDGKRVGMSHLVRVKLKDPVDKAKLAAQAEKLKVTIVGNNKLLPLWYTLACTKNSAGNALEVANKLTESMEFADAEADFLVNFRIRGADGQDKPEGTSNCADDEYFGKQWGLKHTGQHGGTAGMDIRVCDAWQVATGKGVKVAVVDHGIQLDHPDLKANLSSMSFDTVTGTSPSQVRGEHGTPCAGIIGASRGNNKLGAVGVAPEVTLISVSDNLVTGPDASQNLASGLAWAVQNGADVISNSWGHDELASSTLDDAIELALTTGRGGKGCVVVFAAGNHDGTILYPARSNPAILVVGAMSPCAQRKSPTSCDLESWWGSCFGSTLDVVAPGVFIPTTDLTGEDGYDTSDYTMTFNGTSSATPHVAGVAALILQANPDLTQQEVTSIIERTARKVGSYSYLTSSGRPNGTWHREMGHGLVDANACVQAAMSLKK